MAIIGDDWSEKRKIWTLVAVLTYVNTVNYMDRYGVSGVLSKIEKEFELEHWQSGLLQTGLIVCYFIAAPPFGYLGDRYSRKWLMVFAVAIWGVSSLVATFMPEYWSFLCVRATVGIGEAGFTAIAPTIISDVFSKQKRTAALGLFYLAIPVGCGLGYVVTGCVSNWTDSWRWGLRVVPFLVFSGSLLIALLTDDVERGNAELEDAEKKSKKLKSAGETTFKGYIEDVAYLLKNKSFVLTTIAQTLLTFCTGALAWWGPYYCQMAIDLRNEWGLETNLETDSVAFIFGVELTVGGVLGLILGSFLSYWLRPKFDWIDPTICGVSMLVASPFLFISVAFATENIPLTLVFMFFAELFINMNWAVAVDILLYVIVPYRRSTGEAVQVMLCHALGEAGAPYFVGLMAEGFDKGLDNAASVNNSTLTMSELEQDYFAFQYSLYITAGLEVIGAFFYLFSSCFVVADRTKAKEDFETDFVDSKADTQYSSRT